MGKGENMKNKQPLFIILLATFAGFAGGFVSNQFFHAKSAFAEKTSSHQKVVIAEEFRVVDKDGKIFASLGSPGYLQDKSPSKEGSQAVVPQLRLGQESGFQIILSTGAEAGANIILKDEKNRTRTIIGNTELYIPQTQATHRRPVSSIVLFNRLGRFLWSAPGGIRTEWNQ
jgi:hypothetical protein